MASSASVSSCSESVPQLSQTDAKSALNEVIRAFNEPINCQKMSTKRRTTDLDGHGVAKQLDAVRHMQTVFPTATQILMNVIPNYGFSKSGEGVVQFALVIRHMERFDEEIKRLNTQLKTYFLPNLQTNSSVV